MTGTSIFFHENLFQILGTPEKNVVDMYGDSCENLLEILAVIMIVSPMSSVCGIHFRAFSLFFMSEAESSLSP